MVILHFSSGNHSNPAILHPRPTSWLAHRPNGNSIFRVSCWSTITAEVRNTICSKESILLHSLGIFSRNVETSIPYNHEDHKRKQGYQKKSAKSSRRQPDRQTIKSSNPFKPYSTSFFLNISNPRALETHELLQLLSFATREPNP